MSAEICRTLSLAFLIVSFDCLALSFFFIFLCAMFSEIVNIKMEKLLENCTTAMIVVFALSLVSVLNFAIFYLILK